MCLTRVIRELVMFRRFFTLLGLIGELIQLSTVSQAFSLTKALAISAGFYLLATNFVRFVNERINSGIYSHNQVLRIFNFLALEQATMTIIDFGGNVLPIKPLCWNAEKPPW